MNLQTCEIAVGSFVTFSNEMFWQFLVYDSAMFLISLSLTAVLFFLAFLVFTADSSQIGLDPEEINESQVSKIRIGAAGTLCSVAVFFSSFFVSAYFYSLSLTLFSPKMRYAVYLSETFGC